MDKLLILLLPIVIAGCSVVSVQMANGSGSASVNKAVSPTSVKELSHHTPIEENECYQDGMMY